MARLPLTEAWLLSMYFEETGAYQYKKNKELETPSSPTSGEKVDLLLSDENEEEAVYMDVEE